MGVPDERLEPFIEAAVATLREMAGVEAVATGSGTSPGSESDVIAELLLMGNPDRRLVLAIPRQTAAELARRILAEAGEEADDDMIRDCAGELANVIAGQAKTLLFGTPHHFTLATPTVRFGTVKLEGAAVQFQSDAGEFALQVV